MKQPIGRRTAVRGDRPRGFEPVAIGSADAEAVCVVVPASDLSGRRFGLWLFRIGVPLAIYLAQWRCCSTGKWTMPALPLPTRDLADGQGLVSQPGFAPVEGYSNPAWMLLCAGLMKLGLFAPAVSAKLLAAAGMLRTLILLDRLILARSRCPIWASLAGLVFLASNASLTIWCNSGLENSLYACLAAGCMLALSVRCDRRNLVIARRWRLERLARAWR